MKFNLQLFKEAVSGKDIVYLFRPASKSKDQAAVTIAFTTENGRTMSKDADSTETKDGSIRTPGASEIEISVTAIMAKEDTETYKSIETALKNNELMEIWEANLATPADLDEDGTKFKGTYYQGYATEYELNSSAEDHAEISMTFGINGEGADGDVTVTKTQQEIAHYVFKDTVQEME